jgi:hypothetical protein
MYLMTNGCSTLSLPGGRRFDCGRRVHEYGGRRGRSAWFMHTPTSEAHSEGPALLPEVTRAILHFIQQRGISELEAAEPEFVCLLNNLEVGVGAVGDAGWGWMRLWTYVLLTPMGQGHLSSHYWLLLGNLISVFPQTLLAEDRQTEVMTSLEKAQDLEKLETWMLVVWWSMYGSDWAPIQDMERATLTLFRQRPLAIPKFEDLLENHTQSNFSSLFNKYKGILRRVCDEARVFHSRLGSAS